MPELPEVEHVVRALRRAVVGRTIIASEIKLPKLISPTSVSSFKRKIKGTQITGVSRRGKFILIELDGDGTVRHGRASDSGSPARRALVLAVHLRMTGAFLI